MYSQIDLSGPFSIPDVDKDGFTRRGNDYFRQGEFTMCVGGVGQTTHIFGFNSISEKSLTRNICSLFDPHQNQGSDFENSFKNLDLLFLSYGPSAKCTAWSSLVTNLCPDFKCFLNFGEDRRSGSHVPLQMNIFVLDALWIT